MNNNFESQKTREMREEAISTAERCEIQRQLIKEFCKIREMDDAKQRNICASDWIKKYADNFDQLDKNLIIHYKDAQDEEERKIILNEIQKQLEILDEKDFNQ